MLGYYLHKEGRASLIWVGAFALVVLLSALYVDVLWCQWLLVAVALIGFFTAVVFFRMPKGRRYTDAAEDEVIAPADGRIVDIVEMEENEYFKVPRIKISIFMSPLNIHVNRYPVSGRVVYEKYHPGRYLVAFHEKSSELNERNTVVVRTGAGTEILTRQIAGIVARRIVSYARKDDEVRAVQELGFIKFGSRVDVFLPPDADICVSLDDKVRGGTSCIARLRE